MSIRVELYGIPRSRAGVAEVTLLLDSQTLTLGDVLRELADRFPELVEECIDGERLHTGYTASVGGDRFVSQPDTRLNAGDCLLIMSADAGG
jgi:molybdopterin converting factor small subunit